jgi:hypothetical protein
MSSSEGLSIVSVRKRIWIARALRNSVISILFSSKLTERALKWGKWCVIVLYVLMFSEDWVVRTGSLTSANWNKCPGLEAISAEQWYARSILCGRCARWKIGYDVLIFYGIFIASTLIGAKSIRLSHQARQNMTMSLVMKSKRPYMNCV